MPKAKRRCAKAGCNKFQPCAAHPMGWRNSKSQGLPSDWKSRCRAVRNRSGGRCEIHESWGRCQQPGKVVDHIINRASWPDGADGLHGLSNLQHICNFHNKIKTQMESMEGLRRKWGKQ